MNSEMMFSSGLVTALTMTFAACILIPVMYYVWMVYKKRISHVGILAGLAAFFMFSYLISGILLGKLAPESAMAKMGQWPYALTRALCIAISDMAGMGLGLWFLHRQEKTLRAPIGFGLGFRLFDMLWLGGLNVLAPLSSAMTVNRDGLDAMLSQVDADKVGALELQLRALAETSPKVYWLGTVDYICKFVLAIALTRILWYAFEGGREPADRKFGVIVFVLKFLCELMLALYAAGGKYQLCSAAYYVLVAGSVCLAYYLANKRDDPEQFQADRLKGRALPKRRR